MFIPIFFIALCGLAIGSFITMASYRLPKKEEWIKTRSHCASCNHPLAMKDLIPLLSWISQKGKCRYCCKPISYRYPLIELLTACLFVLIYVQTSLVLQMGSPLLILHLTICTVLLIVSVASLETNSVPLFLLALLIPLGVMYQPVIGSNMAILTKSIIFSIVIALVLYLADYFTKKTSRYARYDFYLYALVGFFLPPIFFLHVILFALVIFPTIFLLATLVSRTALILNRTCYTSMAFLYTLIFPNTAAWLMEKIFM